jgi:hypothetical protein
VLFEDCGLIEATGTRPRRGSVEHFYQRTARMRKWVDDKQALDTIAHWLNFDADGNERAEWPSASDFIADVAQLLRNTGRAV